MLRRSFLIPLIASLLTLTGCATTPTERGVPSAASGASATAERELENGTVVDNVRLGIATDCAGPDCEARVKLATREVISRRGRAPSSIGDVQFYLPYVRPGATLGSGGGMILVFDLDDGSRSAVDTFCFTTCFVVGAQPVPPLTLPSPDDHGPMVDPLVGAPIDCSSPDQPRCNEALQVAIAAATKSGFITTATMAETHYYISYATPGSPESAAWDVEYIVNLYVAGEHDNLAEQAVGVYCGTGPCHAVPSPN